MQVSTYGQKQRRRAAARKRKGPCYAKAIRRYLRAGGDPNARFNDMARLGARAAGARR